MSTHSAEFLVAELAAAGGRPDSRALEAVEDVRRAVQAAFKQADAHHGPQHAGQVQELARVILDSVELSPPPSFGERLALDVAALMHDVGYASLTDRWSSDRREHVRFSIKFAQATLATIPLFSSNPHMLPLVSYLIGHHDDTNYQYPSAAWQGDVRPVDLGEYASSLQGFETSLSVGQRSRLRFLLRVLEEADALAATGVAGAQRTYDYSRQRGLDAFAQGNPCDAWSWEVSAAGNALLAAKRAVVDAPSPEWRQRAVDDYHQAEEFVAGACAQSDQTYRRETLPSDLGAHPMRQTSEQGMRIMRYLPWPVLKDSLRRIPLHIDRGLRPYDAADLSLASRSLSDLLPLSYYVLGQQLDMLHQLRADLVQEYYLSLFDLGGLLAYARGGYDYLLAPPIVETYYEPELGAEVSVVLDGLHRVWLARELGIDAIWVAEVRNVSRVFPPVALPVRWADIKVVGAVPSTRAKRRFRFSTPKEVEDILGPLTHAPVTPDNYLYYLYRDLSSLGSNGIRRAE